MIFQFYQEAKIFYRVRAKSKDEALDILQKAQDHEKEEDHYDREEICMDFIYSGEWLDTTPLHPLDELDKLNAIWDRDDD